MQLSTSEISELIKSRLENYDTSAEARTQGTVISVTDGIVRIHGLSNVMSGEMIEFPGNTFGLALNLERDSVGAVVLGSYEHITAAARLCGPCHQQLEINLIASKATFQFQSNEAVKSGITRQVKDLANIP